MRLDAVPYFRKDFYSHVADMDYPYPCPILYPESSEGISMSNSCDFSYIGRDANLYFNDTILSISPYAFFTHVHLCRILYETIEILIEDGDLVIYAKRCNQAVLEKVRELIQEAPSMRIFDKKIFESYFDKFSIDQGSGIV